MTNTTLLFQSRLALQPRSYPGALQVTDPYGASFATVLAEQLVREGVWLLSERPYWGDGGWCVDIAANEAVFTLCVHWLPSAGPGSSDSWAVQVRPHLGVLAGILGTSLPEAAFGVLQEVLEKVVKAEDPTIDLRWSTAGEGAAV
jgi:hypothetical protein